MVKINAERLLADLRELRSFGASPDHPLGVVRVTYSAADMAAREWLCKKLEAAGLSASIDDVGNVLGRSRAPVRRAVLLGSHTDTQPQGGWLDGAMGVVYALECARALREDPQWHSASAQPHSAVGVDVASFADEEGTYLGMVGSHAFCGTLDEAHVRANPRGNAGATGGEPLLDALQRAGLRDGRGRHACEQGRYVGFVEAHIEQGPYLELSAKRIGVVTGIVGIRGVALTFRGAQNHAGTTPMGMRKDAGMAAIKLGAAIDEAFGGDGGVAGQRSVWTFGEVHFSPGSHSIVPGHATLSLQFRDQEAAVLDRMEAKLRELVDGANSSSSGGGGGGGGGGVRIELAIDATNEKGVLCDEALQAHLRRAAQAHAPGQWVSMPSGAAHDAQVLAKVMPAAMLFVPSIGGISHNFEEDTCDDDIVLGCRVFTDAVASIALAAADADAAGSSDSSEHAAKL